MSLRQDGARRTSLLPVLGLGLALGVVGARSEGLVALLLPAGVAVLGLVTLVRMLLWDMAPEDQRRILWWTMVAFAAHLVFGLVVTNISRFAIYLGGDASTYHYFAVELVHHWRLGDPSPTLPAGKEGFYYLLAGLYWLFGNHTTAGIVVNAAAASALVPLVTDTTRTAFGSKAARYVAPLVVLLPGLFLWTSQLLKEACLLLFIAIAANCAGRIVDRVSLGPLVGLASAVALLFTFRGWVALMVLGGLLLGVTLGRHRLTAGISTALTAGALVLLLVLGVGLGSTGYDRAVSSNLEQANAARQYLAANADSGYGGDRDISTPTRALSYLPVGIVALGFGPFPWQVGGPRQLPALADVAVWWLLLPSLWRGIGVARRQLGRQSLVFLLPTATTAILLALAIGNFGTIIRERTQITVLLVPLIALGLAERARLRAAPVAPDLEPAYPPAGGSS